MTTEDIDTTEETTKATNKTPVIVGSAFFLLVVFTMMALGGSDDAPSASSTPSTSSTVDVEDWSTLEEEYPEVDHEAVANDLAFIGQMHARNPGLSGPNGMSDYELILLAEDACAALDDMQPQRRRDVLLMAYMLSETDAQAEFYVDAFEVASSTVCFEWAWVMVP